MAVGLPGQATLDASIFFTVFKVSSSFTRFRLEAYRPRFFFHPQSIQIIGSYVGNRQDAVEAINIAAHGGVKCHYETKPLTELEKSVPLPQSFTLQLNKKKMSTKAWQRER